MKYRRMNLDCENNLDIYGSWNDLKIFFNENRIENIDKNKSQNILTFSKCVPAIGEECFERWGTGKDAEVRDWDRDILEEETEELSYMFLTDRNPPNIWLEQIAKKYPELEFILVYQNTTSEITGEIVYKNSELYHNMIINNEDEVCCSL